MLIVRLRFILVQSNFDRSNTVGSFTMANSNSFLSPHEILPIGQENSYLGNFFFFFFFFFFFCRGILMRF